MTESEILDRFFIWGYSDLSPVWCQCEILVITLMYKCLYPSMVSMNRGNHENIEMNRRAMEHGGGFFDEIKRKYDPSIFLMFQQLFEVTVESA